MQLVCIDEQSDGQRIDNFLLKKLGKVPKSHIYRLLRTGQVRVNGGRKKPVYKLKLGDEVRIPPVKLDVTEKVVIPESIIRRVANDVLFENDELVVLNKKSGLAVHAGSGLLFGVIDALRQLRAETSLELVHRLDRDTSGCLVIARNRKSLLSLQQAFRDNRVKKEYLALTAGVWTSSTCTVQNRLLKNTVRSGERVVEINDAGKTAISHFSVLEQFQRCALVRVRIETGRTHQIRVHAASLGHPVVGDEKYGSNQDNRFFRQNGLKRMYLHAQYLEFIDTSEYRFTVSPDDQWLGDISTLRRPPV